MAMRRWRGLLGALLLTSWGGTATAQSAQSVTVTPLQSLSFGLLLPDRPETVPVTDVARRALVAFSGSGPVDVTLVLPAGLTAANGESIPLRFNSNDAGMLLSLGGTVSPLNPHQVNRLHLVPDRTVHFVLGGTALPSAAHHPGHYTGRVLLIVTQPGT
jgi:hypothetical protein